MKYKLLAVSTGKLINIGDYVQALAAAQFLPCIDGFVEREQLREYDGEPCRIIMNGWYQSDPYQWPPSDKIDPLFVSVNISPTAKWKLLDQKGISYLKNHEPIGCRDFTTMDTLLKRGVNADFSACLTLTLGRKYHSEVKNNEVLFVDPFFVAPKDFASKVRGIFFLLRNYKQISSISKKYSDSSSGFEKLLKITTFYREYRKVFTDETLINANYISQLSPHWKNDYHTNDELLEAAEQLVIDYSKAALVVTSRIQCALPCLSLETPVIFTEAYRPPTDSSCYFSGLHDLFTVIQWKTDHLIPDFPLAGKISVTTNIPENKPLWRPLAQRLIDQCISWVNNE